MSKKIIVYAALSVLFIVMSLALLLRLFFPGLLNGEYISNLIQAKRFSDLHHLAHNADVFYNEKGVWPIDLEELIYHSPGIKSNLNMTRDDILARYKLVPFDSEIGYGSVMLNTIYLSGKDYHDNTLQAINIRYPRNENEDWNQRYRVDFPRP